MAIEKEIMVLLSSYADDEISKDELLKHIPSIERDTEHGKQIESWKEQRELMKWAYSNIIPRRPSIQWQNQLIQRITNIENKKRRKNPMIAIGIVLSLLIIFSIYKFFTRPYLLRVGETITTVSHQLNAKTENGAEFIVGPFSRFTRNTVEDFTIDQGYVRASVESEPTIGITAKHFKLTGQNINVLIGTGPKLDYAAVENGRVVVNNQVSNVTVNRGYAITANNNKETFVSEFSDENENLNRNEDGVRLADVKSEFMPGRIEDSSWNEGIKALADEIPNLRLIPNKMSNSYISENNRSYQINYAPLYNLQNRIKNHFTEIMRILQGEKININEWDIPIGLLQIKSETKDIPAGIYSISLFSKENKIKWRLQGTQEKEIILPVTLTDYDAKSSASIAFEGDMYPSGKYNKYFVLSYWPAKAKPSFSFELKGKQDIQDLSEKQIIYEKLSKQLAGIKDFNLKDSKSYLFYLDSAHINHLTMIWNGNANKKLYQINDMLQKDSKAEIILAAIQVDSQIAEPSTDLKVCLLKLFMTDSSVTPRLRLSPLIEKNDENSDPFRLMLRNEINGSDKYKGEFINIWNPNPIENKSKISFEVTSIVKNNDEFLLRFQIRGNPNEKLFRLTDKDKKAFVQDPIKVWTEGWISVANPNPIKQVND